MLPDEDGADDESSTNTPEPTETATGDDGFGYGSTEELTLAEGDGRDPARAALAKPVSFTASAGDEATIAMTSDVFDTLLVLEGPNGSIVARNDDGGPDLNSRISTTLPESGEYTIWAGSYSGSSTGSYTLSLERGLYSDTNLDDVDVEGIQFGETLESALVDGDGRDPARGALAEPVAFTAAAGDEATITMTSDAFDTLLVLEGPNGSTVARNDDAGPGLNSRISATLPDSGEYLIWAGSYSGSSTGPYTLSLERGLHGDTDLDDVDAETIEFGETLESSLVDGDGRDPARGALAEPVAFTAAAGDEATITMTSDAFDTLLVLEGPNGSTVAQNDDAEGLGLNSRISTTLPDSGEYIIWTGSFSGSSTGPYTLSLERGLHSGTDLEDVDVEEIQFGETLESTLVEGDGRDPERGALAEPVSFNASAGDEATITMTSDDFDTWLVLEGPNGSTVAQNDDAEGLGLNSRISTTLPDSGEYTIWAGSYSGSSTGSYTLSLER